MTQKTTRILMPVAALAVLALLIAYMAGYFSHRIEPGLTDLPRVDSADLVTVASVATPVTEAVPASVEAREATIISSRLLARIVSIEVRAGDQVEPGQILLELEKGDLLARAQQAGERIRSVQARLTEAQRNLQRAQELHGRGLIASADLDTARANALSLEAELALAGQALEEAETAVGFAEIRSPIAGRVVDRFAEPGDTAAPGTKLLSLYNPFSLQVEAQVREQLALNLDTGDEIPVELPASGQLYTGRVEEIVPAADPATRTFTVKVNIPSARDLLPGMYARLLVPAGSVERLLIPEERVARIGQLEVVRVARDGIAEQRFVRLGQTDGNGMIEVLAGLEAGEQLLPRP
ncbi:MAG: efflux RND transporter periplasmic adaptor subunit [Pseudomonadales bacterium]|nr:efflux RND transporter periplasmic adaptor subunit [Halieaceae bacterium]MCP5164885.1 efflux RND transporter periplasmic adaptor subunit [Pseudomonadales bacterium]MCP5189979.1 efflux RND transporter periplasmic adaptor subunit [Pseudomonadales bacterium]MCP5205354.1 efflux RND transporter periplasmic adaptor subunit [Pseudomonadales bacterium]